MSWFSEIAGKAENLLNKIDQNAAVALNTSKDETPSRNYNSNGKGSDWSPYDGVRPSTGLTTVSHSHETLPTSLDGKSVFNEVKNTENVNESKDIKSSSGAFSEQQNGQPSRKLTTMRPKPPRKVLPPSPKAVDNAVSSISESTATKRSDEELLAFLNSPSQREIDETGLLKSELTTQAKEMGLLLKNHRKLQQEHDALKKNLDDVQRKAENSETQLDNRLENSRKQTESLESALQVKNEEIDRLRERLDQALGQLQKVEQLQNVQHRLEQVELENRKLILSNEELTQNMSSTVSQLECCEKQVCTVKEALSSVENEFLVYKEKAKSILKTKDELIVSLKEGQNLGEGFGDTLSMESQAEAEIASLKNERELLHAEISQSRALADALREEHLRLENELTTLRSCNNDFKEQLSNERSISHSLQEENLQMSQHISGLQLELERGMIEKKKLEDKYDNLKKSFESSVGRKPEEDVKNAYSARQFSNRSPTPYCDNDDSDNLRTRITALSQTLLEKQSLINNISADKQLLQIRVERLQAQIEEMSESTESLSNGGLTQTVISSQPLYLSESPWDSRISGRVKRAYGKVDHLCCQIGLAMRQRPNLRLGFCAYILVLHLWVFFILFTWSHHTSVSPDDN